MSDNFRFYLDREPAVNLPCDLLQEMNGRGLLSGSDVNNVKVEFCGVIIFDSVSHVFLPRGVNLDKKSDFLKNDAANLMHAIQIYKNKKKYDVQNDNENLLGANTLDVIFSLLEDYFEYGIYTRRKQKSIVNYGKPNWKKTIADQSVYITDAGPLYFDVWGRKYIQTSTCQVSRIHGKIVNYLLDEFLWIFSPLKRAELPETVMPLSPEGYTQQWITDLEKELSLVYSDRDINLIRWLISYLQDSAANKDSFHVIGVHKFEAVWERILADSLCWVSPVNSYIAAPAYKFSNGVVKSAPARGQRTDVVMADKNNATYVVLDAKYYDAQDVNSSPGWGDIVKQLFYLQAIEIRFNPKKVANVFIFPGSGPLRSVHMVEKGENGGLLDNQYPPIYCLYIDAMAVVCSYVKGVKLRGFSEEIMALAHKSNKFTNQYNYSIF